MVPCRRADMCNCSWDSKQRSRSAVEKGFIEVHTGFAQIGGIPLQGRPGYSGRQAPMYLLLICAGHCAFWSNLVHCHSRCLQYEGKPCRRVDVTAREHVFVYGKMGVQIIPCMGMRLVDTSVTSLLSPRVCVHARMRAPHSKCG